MTTNTSITTQGTQHTQTDDSWRGIYKTLTIDNTQYGKDIKARDTEQRIAWGIRK